MSSGSDEISVDNHYTNQARKWGASPKCSMEDDLVRDRETQEILRFVESVVMGGHESPVTVLDLGCGNGYTLEELVRRLPNNRYYGVEPNEDLLAISRERGLTDCILSTGDARDLDFDTGTFDAVFTQRCIINLLEEAQQISALREIHRVLKPGGYYFMIECFTDGLELLNKAREECELEHIPEAYHNKYLNKERFFGAADELFELCNRSGPDREPVVDGFPYNFVSSHYFVTRILFPFIANGKWKRNTEFAEFFSFLPPIGNYSPLQMFLFRKK